MMTTTRTIAVGAMVALAAVPTDGACETATSPGSSWSITLGTGWLALNGERRLVRGDRTALEDRTLHEKLPGYAEYAAQVRYRLVPGVW